MGRVHAGTGNLRTLEPLEAFLIWSVFPQIPSRCTNLYRQSVFSQRNHSPWMTSSFRWLQLWGTAKDFPTEHMLLLHCSVQSDGSYGRPMLVGTKVGKLEANSLTMHTPPGLWGICIRHAQVTQHWWTSSMYLSSNSSLDKERYRWWTKEESLSRGRAAHWKTELSSWSLCSEQVSWGPQFSYWCDPGPGLNLVFTMGQVSPG